MTAMFLLAHKTLEQFLALAEELYKNPHCEDLPKELFHPIDRKHIRSQLNEILTQDVLSPGWRRADERQGAKYYAQLAAPEKLDDAVIRERDLLALLLAASLSRREREIALAVLLGESPADTARRLGITKSTVYTTRHRVNKKISKIP